MTISAFANQLKFGVMSNMQKIKKTPEDIARGQRIRREIDRSGHNQSTVADNLGMSQSTIAKYCSGTIAPSDVALKKLCDFLKVSSDYLLYGIDSDVIVKHQSHQITKTLIHEQSQNEDQDMSLTKILIENLQKLNEMLMRKAEESDRERMELKAENAQLKEQLKSLTKEFESLKNSIPNKHFMKVSNGNPGE